MSGDRERSAGRTTPRRIQAAVAWALLLGAVAYGARIYVREGKRGAGAPVKVAPAPAAAPQAPTARGAQPPNIVLVVVDTLRSDHVSAYARDAPPTPNIDRVAAGGILFENALSAAPWTAPSLLSIMTGLYPSSHGVWTYPQPSVMASEHITLAEILKARGYATAAFTEGGFAKPDFGLGQGFDLYPAYAGDAAGNFANLTEHGRTAENLARALAWLAARPARPFFLFFHTYGPHFPYDPPDELLDRPVALPEGDLAAKVRDVCARWLADAEITDAEVALAVVAIHRFGEFALGVPEGSRCMPIVRRVFAVQNETTARVVDDVRTLYRGAVRKADRTVGRLLDALDAGGFGDTIVLLTSDHGEGTGEHRLFQHGIHLHRELLHVPLLLRLPGQAKGHRPISELVRTIDILPTLAELAGAAAPPGVQGRSFVPLLGAPARDDRVALGEAISVDGGERNARALRTAEWALIRRRGVAALYDTRRDPGEIVDLSADRGDVLDRLLGEMAQSFPAPADAPPGAAKPTRVMNERELRALGYAH